MITKMFSRFNLILGVAPTHRTSRFPKALINAALAPFLFAVAFAAETEGWRRANAEDIAALFNLSKQRPTRIHYEGELELLMPPLSPSQIDAMMEQYEANDRRQELFFISPDVPDIIKTQKKRELAAIRRKELEDVNVGPTPILLREWYFGNYYRSDETNKKYDWRNPSNRDVPHVGYQVTRVNLYDTGFSKYTKYEEFHVIRTMLLNTSAAATPHRDHELWDVMAINRALARPLWLALADDEQADKNFLVSSSIHDLNALVLRPSKVADLNQDKPTSWQLVVTNANINGLPILRYRLTGLMRMSPRTSELEPVEAEYWLGMVLNRTFLFKSYVSNKKTQSRAETEIRSFTGQGMPAEYVRSVSGGSAGERVIRMKFYKITLYDEFNIKDVFEPKLRDGWVIRDTSTKVSSYLPGYEHRVNGTTQTSPSVQEKRKRTILLTIALFATIPLLGIMIKLQWRTKN